jgi:hypothetical protein
MPNTIAYNNQLQDMTTARFFYENGLHIIITMYYN